MQFNIYVCAKPHPYCNIQFFKNFYVLSVSVNLSHHFDFHACVGLRERKRERQTDRHTERMTETEREGE